MKKILAPVLLLILAFNLGTAAMAQTTVILDDGRFTTVRSETSLTPAERTRLNALIDREWVQVGPIFRESDMAIRAQLRPDQLAVWNSAMTDATRFQLLRMTPDQYSAFRNDLVTRLNLTSSQQASIVPLLDRSSARAMDIHRATFAGEFCDILGMRRHEAFDRGVASATIFEQRVVTTERTVEVQRQPAVQNDTFIRDMDLK